MPPANLVTRRNWNPFHRLPCLRLAQTPGVRFRPPKVGGVSLYRTWRPLVFADLVGQDAVVRTLTAAIENGEVRAAIEHAQSQLEGRGRVLVRASGTEPLVRVMVEAPTDDETDTICARLAELVRRSIGE